jgi:dolichol-phosphate mannosyltransferase
MSPHPDLSVVIPCYNEAANLAALYQRLSPVLKSLNLSYEIIFVDDGSRDTTFDAIRTLHSEDKQVKGLSLSRNFGHQVALAAGLHHSSGNMVITMDGDLQHPPELIPEMINRCNQGFDIVNTKRLETEGAGFFKRNTSRMFYKLMNRLSDVELTEGGADFRLMNKKAVEAYTSFNERDRFNRGLVTWMGFNQDVIEYNAEERFAGKTKYTFRKMLRFAIDGITSFSSRPLRLAAYTGILVSIAGLLYAVYALVRHFSGATIPGWTSMLITVLLLGGVQLISLGVIGEYIARIFNEAKSRPLYFIKEKTEDTTGND